MRYDSREFESIVSCDIEIQLLQILLASSSSCAAAAVVVLPLFDRTY